MSSPSPAIGSVLKGVLGLATGTMATRALAATGQILLAFWLSPTEFGYWAAANAVLAFVGGLANFGEVNGYLSGRGATFAVARRICRPRNVLLACVGIPVAMAYFASGRWQVGALALIVATTIPFQGESDLLYAASVKYRRFRSAVLAQLAAAVTKVLVGVAVAVTTHSAIAIALSTLCYSLALDALLSRVVRSDVVSEVPAQHAVSGADRFSWAVNSWMMTLPLQSGFVVAQFVATPYLLGLYYFSYQVTLGISGIISGPLAKVTLSTIGQQKGPARLRLAVDLSGFFGAAVLIVVAGFSLLILAISPYVADKWEAAIPATVILLASLPMRMMSPVMDAIQQAGNRWWQSTGFNAIDALGTGLAALSLLSGSVTNLALALTGWKVTLGVFRTAVVLADAPVRARISLIAPLIGGTTVLCAAAVTESTATAVALFGCAIAVGGVWLAVCRNISRGAPRHARNGQPA